MGRFSSSPAGSEGEPNWIPNTDIYISEDGHLIIEVELAGLDRESIELTVENGRVKIHGHRSDGGRRRRCKYLAAKLYYGPFESIAEVPPGYDLNAAKAAYHNGLLRIDVPKSTGRVSS